MVKEKGLGFRVQGFHWIPCRKVERDELEVVLHDDAPAHLPQGRQAPAGDAGLVPRKVHVIGTTIRSYALLMGGLHGDGAWHGPVTIVQLIAPRPYIFSLPCTGD